MNRHNIKLLVTLVLLTLMATSAWMASQADARGHFGPGASSHLSATCPGADIAAGDPDAGSGVVPPPPPTMKTLRQLRGSGGWGSGLAEWVEWTSRIWATLYLRAAR